jgi:hypothetical protein
MAARGKVERATRMGRGGDTVKHGAKRYLAIGLLGVALVLGLAAGVAAARGGGPAASVPDAATGGAPYGLSPPNETDTDGGAGIGLATGGGGYRVSPPNESDTGDGAGALRAGEARGVYHLSPPNETDPGSTGAAGAAPEPSAPYRVSPPNEQDPAGP